MELLRLELSGKPGQVNTPPGSPPSELGLLGVDVASKSIDGQDQTVVQVLLDDDAPGFDQSLLDGVLVAELLDRSGATLARDLFDHDQFRRDLRDERDAGISDLRGVLVLTNGELPPHYVRLAFLPVAIADTAGATLVFRRSTVADMVEAVEAAHEIGEIGDDERRSMLTMIEQRCRHSPPDN